MTTSPVTATTPDSASEPIRGLLNEDTDSQVFLQLLIAQIRNQDPLSPQDPTQFVAQLAQFSALEQLIGMRQSLEEISAQGGITPEES